MTDVIVFGIDFGTTFSGTALAHSSKPSHVDLITSWNYSAHMTSDVDKAPTMLLTDDIYNETEWGYGIPSPEKAFKWFKLLLLNDGDIPEELKDSEQLIKAKQTLLSSGHDAVYVVACYLRHMWRHALRCIERERGVTEVDRCRFRIVLTVPAIWPPYATNRMKKAAEIAGMLDHRWSGETVLDIISEPEAAAVATIGDMDKRSDIKKGDSIVICDAGGGTVDLVTYMVKSCNPFVFDEHVKGEGGLCGAILLDENFENLIKDKVGASAWNTSNEFQKQKTMNNEWENCIKRQFNGLDQGRPWLVTLPENCTVRRYGTSKKRSRDMEITSADIMGVFRPIVDQVVDLVARQVNESRRKSAKHPKFIVLVGGFGRSPMLYQRLCEANPSSTVLQAQGSNPWTAACRGAVMHGLAIEPSCSMEKVPASIGTRIARNSYGTLSNQLWDKKLHKGVPKSWDAFTGAWRANEQAERFLKKPVEEELFFSSSDKPPKQNCDEVELLCSIKWNEDIKLSSLPERVSPEGQKFRVLLYEIHVTFDGAEMDMSVHHLGKRVADKSVSIDFDEKSCSTEWSDMEKEMDAW